MHTGRLGVNRRSVIKASALLAAALPVGLLQACGGAATQPPPTVPPAAPAPTSPAAQPVAPPTAVPAAGGTLKKVKYGDLKLLGDIGIYVAMEEGYFAQQGIDLELVTFDSAANMVAPLGAGQLDVGGGALSAGLFNAFARDLRMLIVADKGHSEATPPGFPVSTFLVRKTLVDSGQMATPAGLKGRKIGWVARGISTELDLTALLKLGGLTLKDVEQVQMGFPDMGAAFASGGIDAGGPPEPFATNIVAQGNAVVLKHDWEVNPRNQVAGVYYSADFSRSDLATPFMVAYLRAVRLYNDAFVKRLPDAREKVISAATRQTPVKDRALYDKMTLQALHPDGAMNVQSIRDQQDFFLEQGTQQARIDLANYVDLRFAEAASKQLGPYT